MRTYFDSSSFAKRLIEEPGSEQVEHLCMESSELAIGVVCIPEVISALNRRRREKYLSATDYSRAKQQLALDVRDAFIVNLTESVISSSVAILESNTIRALDALHVACALEWKADLFVSSDRRQLTAADGVGLRTRFV